MGNYSCNGTKPSGPQKFSSGSFECFTEWGDNCGLVTDYSSAPCIEYGTPQNFNCRFHNNNGCPGVNNRIVFRKNGTVVYDKTQYVSGYGDHYSTSVQVNVGDSVSAEFYMNGNLVMSPSMYISERFCQDTVSCSRSGSVNPESITMNVGGSATLTYSGFLYVPTGLSHSGSILTANCKGNYTVRMNCSDGDCSCSCYKNVPVTVNGFNLDYRYLSTTEFKVGIPVKVQMSNKTSESVFTLNDPSAATIVGNEITFKQSGLFQLTCSFPGDCTYNASVVRVSLTVIQLTQVLSYDGPTELVIGEEYNFNAVSDVGLDNFTFTSTDNVIVSNGSLLVKGNGIAMLTVVESGNSVYSPAVLNVTLICSIDNLNPSLIVSGGSDGYSYNFNIEKSLLLVILLVKALFIYNKMNVWKQ